MTIVDQTIGSSVLACESVNFVHTPSFHRKAFWPACVSCGWGRGEVKGGLLVCGKRLVCLCMCVLGSTYVNLPPFFSSAFLLQTIRISYRRLPTTALKLSHHFFAFLAFPQVIMSQQHIRYLTHTHPCSHTNLTGCSNLYF